MRQILIVANQTLGGDALLRVVRERLESGPCEFWIVVPATEPNHDQFLPPGAASDTDAYETAERRLRDGIERLRALDVPVDGEVGDSDPLHAVGEALSRRQIDEVIVSTLPTSVSHWLRLDLPSRVQRKHQLPVTTVTAPNTGER